MSGLSSKDYKFDTPAYHWARGEAPQVAERMFGRMAGLPHDYGILCSTVYQSGGGVWVDIGVLYGASAIMMALTMKTFHLPGTVYAVDPLDGYYGKLVEPPVTKELFEGNVERLGVGEFIFTVAKKSRPWPLEKKIITGAYIDGDHDGIAPLMDFNSCVLSGAEYAVFDNYELKYPDVRRAVMNAANPPWNLVHISGRTAVLKKDI